MTTKEPTKEVKQVSPLPLGRYWLDISGADLITDWNDWKTDMTSSGALSILSNEENTTDGVAHLFVIFRVNKPSVFFQSDRFGYPNTAPDWVKSSQDISTTPDDTQDPTTQLLQSLKTAGKVAAALFVAKLAVDLLRVRK